MTIYLAEQRGTSQSEALRSFHTFNFGAYKEESRKPFGALQIFNDDTLKGGGQLQMHVEENTDILLLPIVGAIAFKNSEILLHRSSYGKGVRLFCFSEV